LRRILLRGALIGRGGLGCVLLRGAGLGALLRAVLVGADRLGAGWHLGLARLLAAIGRGEGGDAACLLHSVEVEQAGVAITRLGNLGGVGELGADAVAGLVDHLAQRVAGIRLGGLPLRGCGKGESERRRAEQR
jgi:hypothetical protein